MSGWMNFFGKKENKNSARDAIVGLRQQLLMLEKKEEHLNKKIEDELKKAKANVTTNKRGACHPPPNLASQTPLLLPVRSLY